MKKKLIAKDYNITNEFIEIVNYSRIIFTYIIQVLYDNNVRLNGAQIQKFLVLDSELDLNEKKEVSDKFLKYEYINSLIDTSRVIDLQLITNLK